MLRNDANVAKRGEMRRLVAGVMRVCGVMMRKNQGKTGQDTRARLIVLIFYYWRSLALLKARARLTACQYDRKRYDLL